jgi:CRP-like cAMP-binding protein
MDTTIERVIFLKGIELFSDIPSELLVHLAEISTRFMADKDQDLFKEGDSSQSVYLLFGGQVQLIRNGKSKREISEPEAIGAWGFFDGKERLMTATCKEDSQFLVINRQDFYDLLEEHANLSRGLLNYFVKRIRKLTDITDAIV